jgi:hypothetical protein
VAEHLEEVIGQAGRLDVSAVGLPQPGIQRIPLTELAADAFARPTWSTAEPCDISSRAHHNPTPHTAAA